MNKEEKYSVEKITYIKKWTEHLFSFRTTRHESFQFIPGQFARLGVINNDAITWRPYSIVSATYDEELEFYSIVVPDGEFTQNLKKLNVGDNIFVDKTNYGLLTTDRFENGKHLWLLSTGTGLAPFISILYDFSIWEQYEKIILVHCARHKSELAYMDTINSFYTNEYYNEIVSGKLEYIKLLTKDDSGADLYGRITDLIKNNTLQNFINIDINNVDSRVMICGNPQMVDDTRRILSDMGLVISKRGKPGNMAVENYW
jgi:ferredoxin--NADP+ reductase